MIIKTTQKIKQERNFKKCFVAFLVILALALIVFPFGWWMYNDELTEMQLFKEWWHVYLVGLLAYGFAQFLIFHWDIWK